MASESDLKTLIREFLKHEAFPAPVYTHCPAETQFGKRGIDMYVCIYGQLFMWECKLGTGKPTGRQGEELKEGEDAEAKIACIHSVREVVAALEASGMFGRKDYETIVALYYAEFRGKDKKFIMLYDKSVLKSGSYGELLK